MKCRICSLRLKQGLADDDKVIILQKLQQNLELVQQLLQGLLNDAVHAQRSA